MPPLLEAARKEGLTILWVLVRPCLYEDTVINDYQAVYDPKTPLSTLESGQQEVVLAEIARIIKRARLANTSEQNSPVQSTAAFFAEQVSPLHVESKPPPEQVPPPRLDSRPPIEPARSTLPAIQNIHGWSAQRVQTLQQQTAQASGLAVEFRDRLKDGSQGPVMVVIPGGRFLMGSPENEPDRQSDERQHEVEVALFAIGKYAVTFEEYDRFAEATKRDKPADQGWGRGRRPVINVTWFDAVVYTEWLSQQTGKTYRLPTEAEWEYACRAGTTTPFYFGDIITPDQANYDSITKGVFSGLKAVFGSPSRLYRKQTVEVGQFPLNAWGLHDMHGNVWEWTCSVYDKDYGGSEQCCTEPGTGGPCVLRGGSWDDGPRRLRGAARYDRNPHFWTQFYGFRLARTLTL